MIKKLVLSVALSSVLILPVFAENYKYEILKDKHNPNVVSFTSDAKLVTFTGRTNEMSGNAIVDFDDISKSTGEIKVHLPSLDTGIEKRNNHMKGVLNVEKHPYAVFKLTELKTSLPKLPDNKPVYITAVGDLTINGVTKKQSAVLELTYLPEMDKNFRQGDWIRLKTDFNIKMTDFNINPPGLIPLKVSDEVKIEINLMGKKM